MADPIKIIKEDHRAVEKLFKQYEGLGDSAFKAKQKLALEIADLLSLHAEMEEQFLYPKLKDEFGDEEDKMVEEAYAEHGVAKELIAEIRELNPEEGQFDAKVKVLSENIAHHVKEEENELLPEAKSELPEAELEQIGEAMEQFRASRQKV